MATDLAEAEFAAMIGVPVAQLAALEKEGLPHLTRAKEKRYPTPMGVTWFIEYSVARRVGGIPPRVNQLDLAALLGIVPRQVKNLVDGGKLPSMIEHGKRVYPLPAAVHEFVKYKVDQVSKDDDKLDALDQAKLRKLTAEAEDAEMDLLQKRGELIDRVTSQRAVAEIVGGLDGQMSEAPSRHSRKLIGLKNESSARKALREIINAERTRWAATVAAVGRRIQVVAEDLTPEPEEASAENSDG